MGRDSRRARGASGTAAGQQEVDRAWQFRGASDRIQSSPTVVDNLCYVGSNEGRVFAIQKDRGVERWRYGRPTDAVRTAPAVVSGRCFVGSDDGVVYAINAQTGDPPLGL
ncbi:MAG: PQQ-binding-like beta-propeller repeat protein [Natrialbaceae archaeon]|nr:PQQ-binding-like beta-propeller repeat protein [Natrialbaceae archaeon]